VEKLCVEKLCVDKVCVAGGGREGGRKEAGGSAEPKTRTPHKDVGKKIPFISLDLLIFSTTV